MCVCVYIYIYIYYYYKYDPKKFLTGFLAFVNIETFIMIANARYFGPLHNSVRLCVVRCGMVWAKEGCTVSSCLSHSRTETY